MMMHLSRMQASHRQQQSPAQKTRSPDPAGGGVKGKTGDGGSGGGSKKSNLIFRNNRNSSGSRLGAIVTGKKCNTEKKVSRLNHETNSKNQNGGSDLDYNEEDMFTKVPKMELLKVNYVNLKQKETSSNAKKKAAEEKKAKGAATSITSNVSKNQPSASIASKNKASTDESPSSDPQEDKSKYLVYKKHNGFGSNPSIAESGAKLQYINDSDVKLKNGKKKYTLFDTKKKNKLETVQYYFDSRSYERYVDNKLYGVINKNQQQQQLQHKQSVGTKPTRAETPKSNSKQDQPDDALKRLSWDLRTNRPSMLRVINQAAISNKSTTESKGPQSKSVKGGTTFKQQPHQDGNNRIFKLQKSHTCTNLITRHRSMNDIHRINQLFQETKATAPDNNGKQQSATPPPPSLPPLITRQHSSSAIALNRQTVNKSPQQPPTATTPKPTSTPTTGAVREGIHRFEKNKCSKSDETSSKQQKYLVHKRYSARSKAEQSDVSSAATAAVTPPTTPPSTPVATFISDDTISKRIRRIIDSHNGTGGSTETIDFESTSKRKAIRVRSKSVERTLSDDDGSTASGKSSKTTCGYKNCKFSNCPMSSSSSGSSDSSTVSVSSCDSKKSNPTESHHHSCPKARDNESDIVSGKRTSIAINEGDCEVLLNNALIGKLCEKRDNIHRGSKIKEIDLETSRLIIEKASPESVVPSRQKFWNQHNQRNMKLNNNPQSKPYNDKMTINNKIRNEQNNSIKIFITGQGATKGGEPISLSSTIVGDDSGGSSAASVSSSSGGDSDKDDGYYDQSERSLSPADKQQPLSIVSTVSTGSTVCSDRTNVSSVTCGNMMSINGSGGGGSGVSRFTSKTSIRLGCDGALFWNNTYFDDSDKPPDGSSESVGKVCCGSAANCCCCCCRRRSITLSNCNYIISSIDADGCDGSANNACDTTGHGGNVKPPSISANGGGGGCNGTNGGIVLRKAQLQCGMAKLNSKIEGFSPRPRSVEGPPDSGISISSDTIIASSDSDLNLQSQTDSDERKLKRGHVLAELLETERIYVAEMGSILKGYRDEMQSEEMSSLVPPGLQGKADILFGNLHELYTFHNDIFLKDLENCISTTELVALCFVQRRDTFFRLYSYYCQNIPRSERLRETLVDTHLFLQECQKKLGHKLPLAAYLLKPVQRITKYQLLLKDLLK
ncbi:rhoGEF domain-containing protein gxcJ isoform X2 [Toxorhynchites rutilus septentrionalis]|nr:rhoGEF domain-containing protein gxcJ isoform X2 [Toxorhynchites rutilus septentrionalis]